MATDQTNFSSPDLSALNEDERKQVLLVIQKAKEFEVAEEKSLMRQPLEGLLYKYTNVVKGYQYRWFVLNPESGKLEYFEREELKRQKPRGSVYLAGAVISPTDEDSQTFSVNAANGEIYKLRAFDAKERQHWVNRIRATAEYHTEFLAQTLPPIPKENRPQTLPAPTNNTNTSMSSVCGDELSESQQNISNSTGIQRSTHKLPAPPPQQDNFKSVKDVLHQVQTHNTQLINTIEDLPPSGEHINSLDEEMLLLKATSNATMACLEQCLSILQQQQHQTGSIQSLPTGGTIEWLDPKSSSLPRSGNSITPLASPAESFVSAMDSPVLTITEVEHDDDVQDDEEYSDTDLGAVEEHKSIILHLLSQLKLGMDLTKVVLPTFILEKRSLLEMFADCMAHPDIFLRIPDYSSPELRMLAVLEWYLTSFHAGRRGALAKKPYNPIIGETFHCSWNVANDSSSSNSSNGLPNGTEETSTPSTTRLTYTAEQVSHHPPISAFYFECPEKKVSMDASIWTKSKFMGMSIGVVMVGKLNLNLLSYDEEYVFGLPSAYARSILTVPWVELGDRVTLTCNKTGYSSSIVFHTKPFYGGKLHKITAEVKNPQGDNVCKVSGEWNGQLEFTYLNGKTKVVDTTTMQTVRKSVRPLHMQGDFESRKLWQNVTNALKNNDIDTATQHKRFLEERQRQGERHRKETSTPFPSKYFHKAGDTYSYNKLLRNSSSS